MDKLKLNKSQRGSSLLEVILAVGLFVLLTPSLVFMFLGTYSGALRSEMRLQAVAFSQQAIEAVRSIRDLSWGDLPTGSSQVYSLTSVNGYWELVEGSEEIENYTREIVFTDVDDHTKEIDVNIRWEVVDGLVNSFETTTRLSNWNLSKWIQTLLEDFTEGFRNSVVLTNEAGGEVRLADTGSWANPQNFTNLNYGGDGNVLDMKVVDNMLYVVTSANGSDDEFIAYDISDISNGNITRIGSYNVGQNSNGVFVSDGYAFIATADNSKEVNIVRLSDYLLVNTIDIEGSADATDVWVEEDVLYVVTRKENSTYLEGGSVEEFFAYDVSDPEGVIGDPTNAFEVSQNVFRLYIKDGYAFLANTHNSREIDIIKLSNFTRVNSVDLVGGHNAFCVDGLENKLFVGRSKNSSQDEFFVLDISDPEGTIPVLGSADIGNYHIYDVAAFEDWAFMVSNRGGTQELTIVDLNDYGIETEVDLSGSTTAKAVSTFGSFLFVGSYHNTDSVQIWQPESLVNGGEILDDTQTEFAEGTYEDTTWNSDRVELNATGLANGVGNYISRVFNAGGSTSWNSMTWTAVAPYGIELPGSTSGDWWNDNYEYRKEIEFGTDHSFLPEGFTVTLNMDTRVASTNVASSSGNDVRIVWDPVSGNDVELDRIADSWDDSNSSIEFRLQSSIAADENSDVDGTYYVYYGFAGAGSAPEAESNVYYFVDNFDRADGSSIGNGWEEWNTGGGNLYLDSNELRVSGNNTGPADAGIKQDFPLGAIPDDFTLSFDWTMPINPEGIWTHYVNIGDSGSMSNNSRTSGVGLGIYNGEGSHFSPNGTENISNDLSGNMENNVDSGPHSIRLEADFSAKTYDYYRGGNLIASNQNFVNAISNLDHIRIATDQYINSATAFTYDNLKIELNVDNNPEEQLDEEEEKPEESQEESGFSEGNADMTGNVLLMHMDESSGAILDYSGNGNNGVVGDVSYGEVGKYDQALSFDGNNDVITIADSSTLDISDEITMEAWLNVQGDGGSASGSGGEIGDSTIDSELFENSKAYEVSFANVSGDVFAVAYRANSDKGELATFSVDSDGQISSVIDSYTFDNKDAYDPDLINVSGDVFAIAYTDKDDEGVLETVEIYTDGQINSSIDSYIFDSKEGYYPNIINISGDVYAIAYTDKDDEGVVTSFEIESDGQISSLIDSYIFDSQKGIEPKIINVSGDTYAIAYTDENDEGWIKTMAIETDGEIGAMIDYIAFDSGKGYDIDIVDVSGEYFAVVYRDDDDEGVIKTVRIQSSGNIISVIDSLTFDSNKGYEPSLLYAFDNVYTVAYRGDGDDGEMKTFEIESNGQIGDVVDSLTFDGDKATKPALLKLNQNKYAIAYTNGNNKGNVTSMEIESGGAVSRGIYKDGAYGFDADSNNVYFTINDQTISNTLEGGWNHVAFSYDRSAESDQQKIYINGVEVASGTLVSPIVTNDSELKIGNLFEGFIDEFAIYNRALTATEILDRYKRGALDLKFQVRSCDDSACDEEPFIGPDGTESTFYEDSTTFSNLSDNQFFQYKAILETTDEIYSPSFYEVQVILDDLGLSSYVDEGIFTSSAFDTGSSSTSYQSIEWTMSGSGSVKFQIRTADSEENLDNAIWVGYGGLESEYLSEEESQITIYPNASGTQWIQYRAFIDGDGNTSPVLEDITINYSN